MKTSLWAQKSDILPRASKANIKILKVTQTVISIKDSHLEIFAMHTYS